MKKLNILVLVKPFWLHYPKHKAKSDISKALSLHANVDYWYNDGDIHNILSQLAIKPDFIFHYDITWDYQLSPKLPDSITYLFQKVAMSLIYIGIPKKELTI